MWLTGVILNVLAFLLLVFALCGTLSSVKLARLAIKSGSTSSWQTILWKATCIAQTLMVWAFILAVLAGIIAIQLKTEWFTEPFGQLLGVSIGLGIMATIIWESTQHTSKAYWSRIEKSLEIALLREGDDKQRERFNASKSLLRSVDSSQRRTFLKDVFNPASVEEHLIKNIEQEDE